MRARVWVFVCIGVCAWERWCGVNDDMARINYTGTNYVLESVRIKCSRRLCINPLQVHMTESLV